MVEKIHSTFNLIIGISLSLVAGLSGPHLNPLSTFIVGTCAFLLIFREGWMLGGRLNWSISNQE